MKKNALLAILAVVVIVAVGYYAYQITDNNMINGYIDNDENSQINDQNNTNNNDSSILGRLDTYNSSEFDFAISYPYDWNTQFFPDDELSPKYNIYIKPAGVPVNAPFDHFANITNVSIFPEGIPTEGLQSEMREVNKDEFGDLNLANNSRVYLLQNGQPYAAYLQLIDAPDSWNSSGYIWLRQRIDNLTIKCLDSDGDVIGDSGVCDPLAKDHSIIREGSIDEKLWNKQKAIVNTLELNK